MTIILPTEEEIEKITRRNLLKFPLYQSSHDVYAHLYDLDMPNKLSISYESYSKGLDRVNRTHLDLHVLDDIFYLLSIGINPEFRGRGNGWSLYQSAFSIAKDLGFHFVRQTPSGGYYKDGNIVESRRNYLLRKGCIPVKNSDELDFILT
jgi:ribosomal protein S18 acetylase RimI-like enzyme